MGVVGPKTLQSNERMNECVNEWMNEMSQIYTLKCRVQLGKGWQDCYHGVLLTWAMQGCSFCWLKAIGAKWTLVMLVVWHCSGTKPAAIAA